jgi:glycosyltransferase involved in cell wall biosynthesis
MSVVAGVFVLHVLPVDVARGAQTYARALRDALDDDDVRHRTLTLFRAEGGNLQPDHSLDVPDGALRRAGCDPRAVRRLREFLRVERPDVVVAHGSEPLKYAVFAGAAPATLVYLKIGVGGDRLRGGKTRFHRWLLQRPRVVAAVSEDAADEARSLGVGDDRLVVVPNGRDPQTFSPAGSDERSVPPQLVFVGHLAASKRPEWFVDTVGALHARGVAVRGAIAGDGPLTAEIADRATAAGVDVLGRVADVPSLLRASDVFVFTSISEGEGMPGVLIEAGLSGLPTVTTAVPGARDVVDDGRTGFVVGVDDFDALVNKTASLVTDATLRTTMGAAARERCVAQFGLEASFDRWRALLATVEPRTCTSST